MYLSYGVAAIIGNLYTSILIDESISLSIIFIPIIVISVLTIGFVSHQVKSFNEPSKNKNRNFFPVLLFI